MTKFLLTSAIVAGLALTAGAARADETAAAFKPYVGFDLMRTNVSYDNYDDGVIAFDYEDFLDDSLNGAGVHIGTRFNENFGAELGYFRTREEDKDLGAGLESKVKMHGVSLDALGYLPVASRVDLIGTAGVSYIKAEMALDTGALGLGTLKADESEFGFRVGAGAQAHLTDSVSLRALARYQTADFDNVADRAWVYSAGVNYSF